MNQFCALLLAVVLADPSDTKITVASKSFTESAILGEMIVQLAMHDGYDVVHKSQLGGTGLVWNALLAGDVDVYPDYTGTIVKDILKDDSLNDHEAIRAELEKVGVSMTRPLGFDNSYEIGMKTDVARQFGIESISDLRRHPEFSFGFGTEFMDREDGWPGLRSRYSLPQTDVKGMEHTLSYRALGTGDIHAMDIYSTDANVKKFDIRILDDDLNYFPTYEAVILYRSDLVDRAPQFIASLERLVGQIDHETMLGLNAEVDLDKITPRSAANAYLVDAFSFHVQVRDPSLLQRMGTYTADHLFLVVVSLTAAIAVAVPLGVLAAKRPPISHAILATAEIIQTIPGLALLVLLMTPLQLTPFSTVGKTPTIIALFLYSLLPIIRNTYGGLQEIPASLRESATALGLTPWAQLTQIELPMASRMILNGIKTTAVINVGYATLGGLIGAGGYGAPILEGLYRSDIPKMLEGAIPAAILALLVKYVFEWSQLYVVPKGLRIQASH